MENTLRRYTSSTMPLSARSFFVNVMMDTDGYYYGTINQIFYEKEVLFYGLDDAILKIDHMLDELRCPQASTELREFDEKKKPDLSAWTVEERIEEEKKKYNFQWRDVIRIIHIVDTDGAFTHNYVENKDLNDFLYYEDHIEAKSILAIEARNKQKSELMLKLYSTGKIRNIPYRVYYNSRNLEHVLHDILINLSDEEKQQLADNFSLKYEGHLQDFIEFVSSNRIAVSGSYKETWKFIQEGLNSLHRHSNMHQIFQTEQEVVPKDTQGQNP